MAVKENALHIVKRLRDSGYEAYLAGGCVRDEILGREPQDYDIATGARPEEIQNLFPHTVPVGSQFGVILVVWEGTRMSRQRRCAFTLIELLVVIAIIAIQIGRAHV